MAWAYSDFKYLNRRTYADKVFPDKAKDPKYDEYQRGLVSMVHKFFNKQLLVVVWKRKIFLIKN